MNLPNKLTLLRVCLIPFFVVFAKMGGFGMQLAAVAIYVLACVTDALDGHIARSRGLVTNFGKFMDPIADKLLVMSAIALLVLVPVEGDALLGSGGILFANILLYIALALTVVSGADYILRNRDCIRDR